jgi:hypothetical protein
MICVGASTAPTVSFDGLIDEVKVYASARGELDIAVDAQLVLRYDFAHGAVRDSGPNRLDGVATEGISAGEDGSLSFTANGNGGAAAYLLTPGVVGLAETNGAFTIDVRVQPTASIGGVLLHVADSESSDNWCASFLGLTDDGHPAAQLYSGSIESLVAPQSVEAGAWTRLTQTYSPVSGLKLYVDGSLVATDPGMTAYDASNAVSNFVFTGGLPATASCSSGPISAAGFDGSLDALGITRAATSADEIAASAGLPKACANIQAEHPAYTTAARDVALCGARYDAGNIQAACAAGWQVCTQSTWNERVLPEGFDPNDDPAPAIAGSVTSWGSPQAHRCVASFWEANRPSDAAVWNGDVCDSPYNPWNDYKALLADDGETILFGNGGCCDWDSNFSEPTATGDVFAVYCCKM